jgi:hypothetical protein
MAVLLPDGFARRITKVKLQPQINRFFIPDQLVVSRVTGDVLLAGFHLSGLGVNQDFGPGS